MTFFLRRNVQKHRKAVQKSSEQKSEQSSKRLGVVVVCAVEHFKRYQFAYRIDGEIILVNQLNYSSHEEAVEAGLEKLNKLVTAALQLEMELH